MKYKVLLCRVEYLSQVVEVDTDDPSDAEELAWNKLGDWRCVNAEQFTNGVEELCE